MQLRILGSKSEIDCNLFYFISIPLKNPKPQIAENDDWFTVWVPRKVRRQSPFRRARQNLKRPVALDTLHPGGTY